MITIVDNGRGMIASGHDLKRLKRQEAKIQRKLVARGISAKEAKKAMFYCPDCGNMHNRIEDKRLEREMTMN